MKVLSRFFRFLKGEIPLMVLFCIAFLVAVLNFDGTTWLTGWDTLHPEFDFALNFKRLLFGVWREDQGLGAVAAHAHMSDLPRVIILWLLSLVAPIYTVKKLYVLICFVFGPIGVFQLVRFVLQKYAKTTIKISELSALVAGVWYIFNLGTVQHFYVVFEMFAVQYAAIGWLFYFSLKYLEDRDKRTLLKFAVVSLMAAPMAYASTLWFALAGALGMTLVFRAILMKSVARFWSAAQVGLVLVASNLFWLLPNVYFLLTGASNNPKNAHINELFSTEAFLQNKAFGTIEHLPLLRNFLFNWSVYDNQEHAFRPLLEPWIAHLEKIGVTAIGLLVALMVVLSFSILLVKKWRGLFFIVPAWFFSLFMLINENPPFTQLFRYLRTNNSFFEEGLRFPFTKFSLVFMVASAVLLSVTTAFSLKWIQKFEKKSDGVAGSGMVVGIVMLALLYSGFPLLSGQLIAPKLNNEIPQSYLRLFEFMKTQPQQSRVVQLPMQTLHGWDYMSWGYEGPGFIWFGLPQATVVRDFDRWNSTNETLYKQLSTSLYELDGKAFKKTADQYDIEYFVLDENIIAPQRRSQSVVWISSSKTLLTEIGAKPVWSQDRLTVYQLPDSTHRAATIPANTTVVSSNTSFARVDPVSIRFDNYREPIQSEKSIVYPFSKITEHRVSHEFDKSGDLLLNSSNEVDTSGELVVPGVEAGTLVHPVATVELTSSGVALTFAPSAFVKQGEVTYPIGLLPRLEIQTDEPIAAAQVTVGGEIFTITADKTETKQLQGLVVGDPLSVVVQLPLGSVLSQDFNASIWDNVANEQRYTLNKSSSKTSLQLLFAPLQRNNLLANFAQITPLNCDLFQRGNISVGKDRVRSALVLTAEDNGAVCLGSTVEQPGTQIIRVIGYNDVGRSIKLYLENNNNQRLELEHLGGGGDFDEVFTIPNWGGVYAGSYWASVENRSVAGEDSVNTLLVTESYSLPVSLSYLTSIHVEPTTSVEQKTAAKVSSSQKISPTRYVAQISADSNSSSTLLLSQSHDPGWIAFPGNRFWQPYPHTIANGWQNAWVIPASQGNSAQTFKVTMVFWPQYLEFAGFVVLPVVFGWIVVLSRREARSLPRTHLSRSREVQQRVRRVLG
ncbi:MAG: hypothetical protein WAU07_00160 [Microgenomates group bacterium]